jgi:thymidylate synthase (FAD)
LTVELVWAVNGGDDLVAKMARVSNPGNEDNKKTAPRLINYLMRNRHWSPFEMVNACVYIECPRDISRQLLRHRSFTFQEYSGRYAEFTTLGRRDFRLRDHKNRQNSICTEDVDKQQRWDTLVSVVRGVCLWAYNSALDLGAAPEVARVLLPEGLVPTRLYVNGTLRSWIHYWSVRCDPATQKEHREVAEATREIILREYPMIKEALEQIEIR